MYGAGAMPPLPWGDGVRGVRRPLARSHRLGPVLCRGWWSAVAGSPREPAERSRGRAPGTFSRGQASVSQAVKPQGPCRERGRSIRLGPKPRGSGKRGVRPAGPKTRDGMGLRGKGPGAAWPGERPVSPRRVRNGYLTGIRIGGGGGNSLIYKVFYEDTDDKACPDGGGICIRVALRISIPHPHLLNQGPCLYPIVVSIKGPSFPRSSRSLPPARPGGRLRESTSFPCFQLHSSVVSSTWPAHHPVLSTEISQLAG